MTDSSIETTLVQQVSNAITSKQPLCIQGGNSKWFYGQQCKGDIISTKQHQGILNYEPGELVVTCRSGTRLTELLSALAENNQTLAFEPPVFSADATVGGLIACGFSGPARPWAGSLRDHLLGVKIINGQGEVMQFGGQVMKNVAGYDVSRLMSGSMGTLGIILEASFKVLPMPARQVTLEYESDEATAIQQMNVWSGQPLPISAACFDGDLLRLRLAGAESEIDACLSQLQPDKIADNNDFWQDLKEHKLPFFLSNKPLWRVSVASTTPPPGITCQ